jgi:hypothetical protein
MLTPTAPQLCSHLYVVLGINCIYAGQREQGEEEEEAFAHEQMYKQIILSKIYGKVDEGNSGER